MVGSRTLTRHSEVSVIRAVAVAEADDVGIQGVTRVELGVEASMDLERRNRVRWLG